MAKCYKPIKNVQAKLFGKNAFLKFFGIYLITSFANFRYSLYFLSWWNGGWCVQCSECRSPFVPHRSPIVEIIRQSQRVESQNNTTIVIWAMQSDSRLPNEDEHAYRLLWNASCDAQQLDHRSEGIIVFRVNNLGSTLFVVRAKVLLFCGKLSSASL